MADRRERDEGEECLAFLIFCFGAGSVLAAFATFWLVIAIAWTVASGRPGPWCPAPSTPVEASP